MLDFRAVLSKLLYTFYSSRNVWDFAIFVKTNTENQSVKNKQT